MPKSQTNQPVFKLRRDSFWEIVKHVMMMLAAAVIFCISVFQIRSAAQQSPDEYAAAALFCILLPFAFLYLAIQLGELLQKGYILFAPAERNSWALENFDTAQTLQIGPLTGIEHKNLVLKVRWQPLTEQIPQSKSFKLAFSNNMPVPTAKLQVRLVGLGQNGEFAEQAASNLMKVMSPRCSEGGVYYSNWQELTISPRVAFPEYLLEISMAVKYGQDENETEIEKLEVELFVGDRLGKRESQPIYRISNVATAAVLMNE